MAYEENTVYCVRVSVNGRDGNNQHFGHQVSSCLIYVYDQCVTKRELAID